MAVSITGITSILIKPKRTFGPFTAMVVIEEQHHDVATITQHPVESGARIADHVIIEPSELRLILGWSNSPNYTLSGIDSLTHVFGSVSDFASGGSYVDYVSSIYKQLVELMRGREPFDIVTGKRKYTNMVIRAMSTETNINSENSLVVYIDCQEILTVDIKVTTLNNTTSNKQYSETQNVGRKPLRIVQ